MTDLLGYGWLVDHFNLALVQRLRVTSRAGMRRHTTVENGYVTEVLTQNASPNGVRGHLTFALKHEGVALELLSRLFAVLDPAELLAWIAAEPTGEYARRTCFLYEWITGNELDHGDAIARGNYVNVIDDERYLTSTQPELNRRWRVRNNLPGTPAYCPTVFRTERVKQAERYDCAGQMAALQAEFGEDLLMRSAVWLTLKESRSSFAIEHAESQKDRIQRFAAVMAERCGFYDSPLDPDALATLQSEILGDAAIRFGLRQSPVFVGSVVRFAHVVHYIAPQAADVASLLGGLAAFERCTRGRSPIVRAAALSFGFVYIHPLADGNGRISRFLVNDVLRRDQAIALPLILPISATITESAAARAGYDRVLEQFSRPFMLRYASAYRFGDRVMYDDGVLSDLEFSQYQDALHSWRFPDLTSHAEYLADVIEETVRVEMRSEAKLLRRHDSARAAIKDVVEIPNTNLDRIIQSLIQNDYRVSGKLKNTFPMITERSGLWEQITQAVRDAMIDDASMQADPGGE